MKTIDIMNYRYFAQHVLVLSPKLALIPPTSIYPRLDQKKLKPKANIAINSG